MTFRYFLDSIILLGSLQGFIVAALLFRSRERYSSRLSAWLLLILATASLKIYLNNTGVLSNQWGALVDAFVPFIVIMPVGPLLYFYFRSELDPGFRIQKKDRVHFYPVVLDVFQHVSAVLFLIILLLGWANARQNNFGRWLDDYNVYVDVPRWISLTVYLFLSFRMLIDFAKQPDAAKANVRIGWLRELLWVFGVYALIWLCYLVPYVIPSLTDKMLGWFDWYPVYLPLVLIIYWLGIRSLLLNRDELPGIRRGAGKPLPKESLESTMQLLKQAMEEERLYRDPELTLSRLAAHLDVPARLVSAAINQESGKSFNEFINYYRVEEFKGKLLQSENKKYTITALAFECGFNSQPTFQRAFKNIAGITPSEYAERHGNNQP
jgi:AraC-like DNA-binding protein